MTKNNRLLIIDDDSALTQMLEEYLQQHEFAIKIANHPQVGIDLLQSDSFDLLLLDVMMPDKDGFQVLAEIRRFSSVPVIMLTAKGEDYDRILGLELGADDYLPKPFNHRELVARIKALLRRINMSDTQQVADDLHLHNIHLSHKNRQVKVGQNSLELTATEFHLLAYLMQQPGVLSSKEDLSKQVLGRNLCQFDRSLDMHVSNVRRKLAQHGVNNIIQTVRGAGYILLEQNP